MHSLRRRLLLAAFVAITIALLAAGVALTFVFERAVRARVVADLGDQIDVLVQAMRIETDNRLTLQRQPADPRFERPYGGLYWQLGRDMRVELRSRSLSDQQMAWPGQAPRSGETRWSEMPGPSGQDLIAVERQVMIDGADGATPVRFMVGLDANELEEARLGFFEAVIPSLFAIGLALLAGVWAFLRFGLQPLEWLKTALADVRMDRKAQIEGTFPEEVQPLVAETNALIAARDADLQTARARAGDLAHALKTPLAVMAAQVRTLRLSGHVQAADEIGGEVERLQGVITRELLRARASLQANRRAQATDIAPAAERTCRALGKLASNAHLHFEVRVPADLRVKVDETDFLEMLGNLVDNAAKWARTTVRVEAQAAGGRMKRITVSDDGPGMAEASIDAAMRRGVRLDEQVPGHGFGLGITRDLVEAYGGQFSVARDPALGGVMASLVLPAGR
jgi:signal transduction histidine kinase